MKNIRTAISRRVHDQRMQNRLHFGSALGLSVGLVLTFVLLTGIFGSAPSRLSDVLYQFQAPSGQVLIVAIDDTSVKEIGNLPWSRATVAALVDTIAQAQPRVIGLDLILIEPSDDDETLSRALARAPSIVQPIVGVDVSRLPSRPQSFPRFDVALSPAPALQTPGTKLGHMLIVPDPDNVVRRVPLALESGSRDYPAFGIAVLESYQGQTLVPQINGNQVALGALRLPVDDQGQMLLNFFSPSLHRTLAAADVLRGRVNLASLHDKIVLIGVTGSAIPGSFQTPLADNHGVGTVEVQADLIETILCNRLLEEQDRLTQIVMIFLLAILAGATLPHFRFLSAAALAIIYFLLYLGYAFAQFNRGIIVQPLYPVLALLFTFIGAMTFRHFYEERRRALTARLLRRYVAPEAIDQVTQQWDHGTLPLEGIRREVTVLAIDLSNLETLAESLTAKVLIKHLDQYVTLIVSVIFRHNGSVVKHTGSAILAAWNLLTEQPDHAHAAVQTAIEIKREMAEFNRTQPKELVVKAGIGISTGNVIAGRIGTLPRAEYTIVGEIVGMAERIALKPERGVFIDATTHERIGDEFDLREVNPVRLRNKTESSPVWQLIEPLELTEETIPESVEASE